MSYPWLSLTNMCSESLGTPCSNSSVILICDSSSERSLRLPLPSPPFSFFSLRSPRAFCLPRDPSSPLPRSCSLVRAFLSDSESSSQDFSFSFSCGGSFCLSWGPCSSGCLSFFLGAYSSLEFSFLSPPDFFAFFVSATSPPSVGSPRPSAGPLPDLRPF